MKTKLKTFNDRKSAMEKMFGKYSFNNKVLILGCGGIGTSLTYVLRKFVNIPLKNITIIDKVSSAFKRIDRSIKTINIQITKDNYKDVIINQLKMGKDDLIIDASYDISTNDMFILCNEYGISYTSSSVESWPDEQLKPEEHTFYSRIKSMEDINENAKKKNCNFVVSMGCNPGNVSIWTLYALERINKIKHNFKYTSYADLAKKLGLKVIHVSENDTQVSSIPKPPNTYLNTWSSDAESWYDEAFNNLEISWGSHEETKPKNINISQSNEYQLVID